MSAESRARLLAAIAEHVAHKRGPKDDTLGKVHELHRAVAQRVAAGATVAAAAEDAAATLTTDGKVLSAATWIKGYYRGEEGNALAAFKPRKDRRRK